LAEVLDAEARGGQFLFRGELRWRSGLGCRLGGVALGEPSEKLGVIGRDGFLATI
jgi:hypothetical protein